MLTLYGYKGSGSAAIETALEWTGAPYRRVAAASWVADSALEELARVNPLLQIPTLVLADGTVLTESAAILIHLGLEFPDAGLLPQQASARAQAIRGLVYIAANCYSAIGIDDYPERWLAQPDEASRAKLKAGTRERMYQAWERFADQFPAHPFLGGVQPGALDLLACVVSKWSGTRAQLRDRRPGFFALVGAIEAHPRVRPVFERHWPA